MKQFLYGVLVMMACWPSVSPAVDVQYLLSTGAVTGVSDAALTSVSGYGLITLPSNVAADIIWPLPSGCASGKALWSKVDDPDTFAADGTGIGVRTGLIVFHTTSTLLPGCYELYNAAALWDLVNITLTRAMSGNNPLAEVLGTINVAALSLCPSSETSSDCDDVRTDIINLIAAPPGTAAALHLFLLEVQILLGDVAAFITAQGW